MPEKIHILLPVHNRREITRRFVQCLKRQTYVNYHLILIDDGSTDGTEEMVLGEIGPVTSIKGHGDWWWAGSLQQGYDWLKSHEAAPNDLVLIINDDTEFDPVFLETGSALLQKHRQTLVLAQAYDRLTKQLIDTGIHVIWKQLKFSRAFTPDEINCLSTRGLFLRVSDFFKTGGFYPRLLPHYLSDYEFTIRAQRRGLKLYSDPTLLVLLDMGTTGYHEINNEPFADFVKKFFSIKSASNPFAWTVFIAMACPWPWKIVHILRLWIAAACTLISYPLRSGKTSGFKLL